MQSVTSEIRAEFQRYGQTNNTRPNFVWPQFVEYNALSKARALGSTNDLFVTLNGTIGAQGGTQTLFFALHLPEPGFMRIRLNSLNRYEDKYLYVGLSDSNAHAIQLDDEGYAYHDQTSRNLSEEELKLFQPGVYFFSVGSSQWATIPFSVSIEAFKMIAPSELPVATTEQAGIVQLSTALHSRATNRAATPSAVKTVYDYAENAVNTSQQAIDSADYARGLATEAQSTALESKDLADQAEKDASKAVADSTTAVATANNAQQLAQEANKDSKTALAAAQEAEQNTVLAKGSLQRTGGVMTGTISFQGEGGISLSSLPALPS